MRVRYSAGKDGKLVKKAIIYTCDEHGINFADVDSEAVSIVRRLKDMNFDTYIVGGAVRDLILGKKPKDFDIVSAASPARIKKIFRNSRIIGRRFRLVHVYFGQRIFEVSTFRSLKDGHTSNTFGTIEDDAHRRDFTMNALYYDPLQQTVADYVGGMNDIKKRQVNPIIPLKDIFTDDPVRMIRAVKYAAAADFSLPFSLQLKIKNQSHLLSSISPSRLTEEIFKVINCEKAGVIADLLEKMGLYAYIQPEAARLMRKNLKFRQCYLQSLGAINRKDDNHGQGLYALFCDYLESTQSWTPGVIENYRDIFKTARAFLLPMNPPRYNMEHAVRKFLSVRGISIKRVKAAPGGDAARTGEAAAARPAVKRKRRRRRKSAGTQRPQQAAAAGQKTPVTP
ncbi:MAG: polynucleotide adenylyltransferase PcnB [Treponema sp.]|jgi:poly(A) polymerase|nr:polynucleotide adenylyltransferase PcnB [Treponema sp.]